VLGNAAFAFSCTVANSCCICILNFLHFNANANARSLPCIAQHCRQRLGLSAYFAKDMSCCVGFFLVVCVSERVTNRGCVGEEWFGCDCRSVWNDVKGCTNINERAMMTGCVGTLLHRFCCGDEAERCVCCLHCDGCASVN
jgi:hypothetical protein